MLGPAGYVMISGGSPGARIMAVAGTNGHVFQSELAPQRPYDPGPQPLPPIAGSHVVFEGLIIDGYRNDDKYPADSNVSRVTDPGRGERWDARGRLDGNGPWFNGLDLAFLDYIRLTDVTIYDAPTYGARFNRCTRVRISGGGVEAPRRLPNTDGYHFDGGCTDVVISDVTMATGDDAIAINPTEGFGVDAARFVISNVLFDDCSTGVRVHGSAVATHQITITNITGTVLTALLVHGAENWPRPAPEANHSVTISHSDVKVKNRDGALVWALSSGGSLTLSDVKLIEPAEATPFLLFSKPNYPAAFVMSEVVLNECAIYRNDFGPAEAYLLNMHQGKIGTLVLNNFRVSEQAGRSYSPIPHLMHIAPTASIDTLIVEGGHYQGVAAFVDDPERISHFGGSGLVATGLQVPASKTLPGCRFLNADAGGDLYENIGGGKCVRLATAARGARFTPVRKTYLELSSPTAALKPTSSFTVGFFINLRSVSTPVWGSVIGCWDDPGRRGFVCGWANAPNRFAFVIGAGSNQLVEVHDDVLAEPVPGTWYFVIAWYDADLQEVGIMTNNGGATTASVSWVPDYSSLPFRIGSWSSDIDTNPEADLDMVFVLPQLLTPAQKAWLYNAGAGRSYRELPHAPNPLIVPSKWHSFEDSNDLGFDSTGSNHLTNVNGVAQTEGIVA